VAALVLEVDGGGEGLAPAVKYDAAAEAFAA
jgi:hypothetical protein